MGVKRYVDVVARWYADGHAEPLIICWPDGRSFNVQQVKGHPQSNTFPGAHHRVLRYSVSIETPRGTKDTRLFLELDAQGTKGSARWFVEQDPSAILWKINGCS